MRAVVGVTVLGQAVIGWEVSLEELCQLQNSAAAYVLAVKK
jgi:hypothetical protein